MKYKVGDKVRIKSLDWYNENKDEDGDVPCDCNILFLAENKKYLGTIQTVEVVYKCVERYLGKYIYKLKGLEGIDWTDEMIEGLVEEETKPKFKVGDRIRFKGTDIGGTIVDIIRGQLVIDNGSSKMVEWPENVALIERVMEEETKPTLSKNAKLVSERFTEDVNVSEFKPHQDEIMKLLLQGALNLPDGYIFKDENGNVINATKIVLEKKKKEYPKTYEECMQINNDGDKIPLKIIGIFTQLINARNAYWKIAGEEMGLGKPWEPEGKNTFGIFYDRLTDEIEKQNGYHGANSTLEFPTEEMRDAFYENFKNEIEQCKELL